MRRRAAPAHEQVLAEARFGSSVCALGDLDGDGTGDVALGSPEESLGGTGRGAVHVVRLGADGAVRDKVTIGSGRGGFTGALDDRDAFGWSVEALGDLDGDGVVDVAVGAPQDDDGVLDGGAVWILFLTRDGAVRDHAKLSAATLARPPDTSAAPAAPTAPDGTAPRASPGAPDTPHPRATPGAPGQPAAPAPAAFDWFGVSLACLGDLSGDGTTELAVGAMGDGRPGGHDGALWIVSLAADGTGRVLERLDARSAAAVAGPAAAAIGSDGALSDFTLFGYTLAAAGDANGDGVPDLVVGSWADDSADVVDGVVWMLYLERDGGVSALRRNRAPPDGVRALMARLAKQAQKQKQPGSR